MFQDSDRSVYRILDASVNRVNEGFRTIEESARFLLDDAGKSATLKSLRHDFAAAVDRLSRESLLAARDTPGDVGTAITLDSEQSRESVMGVIAAAASRVQQSLRVIEEYGKTLDGDLAATAERIRYAFYSVAAEIELQLSRLDRFRRLQAAQLYCLIEAGESDAWIEDQVSRLSIAGVDVFQIRDPSCDDRTLYRRTVAAVTVARDHGTLLIVNDRADIAVAAGADGVHVGQDELPCPAVRRVVGAGRLIGVSTHSVEQATAAVADGADYLGCGPVYPSRTKAFDSHVGTALLQQIANAASDGRIPIPVFAIGGIETDNVRDVVAAGISRIAVTGAIRDAEQSTAAAAQLKSILIAEPSD